MPSNDKEIIVLHAIVSKTSVSEPGADEVGDEKLETAKYHDHITDIIESTR